MGKELQLWDESAPQTSSDAHQACSEFSPFSSVLRSKGLLWVDTQVANALTWSHAGRSLCMENVGAWTESDSLPADVRRIGPRTELVFIGANMDEAAMRTALDACVLTEEEHKAIS